MRRRGGSAEGGRVVAVTGADTALGRAVLAALEASGDGAPRAVGGRGALAPRRLRGVDTVVHLDSTYDARLDRRQRREQNITGTRDVLEAARLAGVRRVVLLTSAEVYGAAPSNPIPLADDARLRAEPGEDLLGDHVEMERLAAESGVEVAMLRPATLVGGPLGPAYDGVRLGQLSAPRLLAARGVEPRWQLCHSDDLVSAVVAAVTADLTGPLPVAASGSLRQAEVERIVGRRRLELPAAVAMSTAERLHRLGVAASSPRELDHLLGPVVVACDRLREAGWTPTWSNEAALRAYIADQARTTGRAGAYTAAGATVALLGTAALVRQARRRRRGL